MSIFSSNKETRDTNTSNGYTPPAQTAPTYTPPAQTSSSSVTSIAEGTSLEGQIKIEGDIRIDGMIKGGITSKGKVTIAGAGKVDGDIICQSAEIAGHVTGKLKIADVLYLRGNAVVDGDINTGKLVIESGVRFNGNCTMGAVAAAAPKPQATAAKVELSAQ
jgi:cytoskeletal protein CcmA (bactofilin family)